MIKEICFLKMIKLLVILFIIKLYARNNIFKLYFSCYFSLVSCHINTILGSGVNISVTCKEFDRKLENNLSECSARLGHWVE